MSRLKQALKVVSLRVLIRALGAVLVLALTFFSIYRYKRAVTSPPSSLAPAPAGPALALPTLPPEQTPPPIVYQSKGRRDPFLQPRVAAPQKGPGVNLKVTGIVQGPRSHYALVESESPTGTGFVIRENDVVDSARVLKITNGCVIFEVVPTSRDGKPLTRRVQKCIEI